MFHFPNDRILILQATGIIVIFIVVKIHRIIYDYSNDQSRTFFRAEAVSL